MRVVADESHVARLIDSLAGVIGAKIAQSGKAAHWGLVGIRSRGDVLAGRVRERLAGAGAGHDAVDGRVGTLDITLYRDDLSEIGPDAVVRTTEIPFSVDGLNVVLLDDVLMSGRSIRAALQQLMDLGRPRRVWLAVLVDRGGRELPIAPDFVAMDLAAPATTLGADELVDVHLKPTDDRDEIIIRRRGKKK